MALSILLCGAINFNLLVLVDTATGSEDAVTNETSEVTEATDELSEVGAAPPRNMISQHQVKQNSLNQKTKTISYELKKKKEELPYLID